MDNWLSEGCLGRPGESGGMESGRDALVAAARHFADAADPDGRTAEQMAILYLSGWKPDPSQAAPARRGSATMSLAEALKGKAG